MTYVPVTEERKKAIKSDKKKRRLSHKCPVIIQANKTLNEAEGLTIKEALGVINFEIFLIPEAAATVALIHRLQELEE